MEISLVFDSNGISHSRSSAELEVLLRDARPWLYRLALAITASAELAEDATQEALIRATRSTQKLQAVDDPRAWLRTVTVRCAISALSARHTPTDVEESLEADPTESVAVRMTLSRLTPTDRAILALAHFEELSYAEIGAALDLPLGTVASRLHAARSAFRKEWSK
jgi:RNA polymerase sigma-70 factor (ECF subfamily)